MFWDQKASASQNEHYQLIPEKKTSCCRLRPIKAKDLLQSQIICFKVNRFLVTPKNTMNSEQYLVLNN